MCTPLHGQPIIYKKLWVPKGLANQTGNSLWVPSSTLAWLRLFKRVHLLIEAIARHQGNSIIHANVGKHTHYLYLSFYPYHETYVSKRDAYLCYTDNEGEGGEGDGISADTSLVPLDVKEMEGDGTDGRVHILGMHAHAASHSHSHPEGHHMCNDVAHEHVMGQVGHTHGDINIPNEGGSEQIRHVVIAQVSPLSLRPTQNNFLRISTHVFCSRYIYI